MKTVMSMKNNFPYMVEGDYNTAISDWHIVEGILADVREQHDCMEDNAMTVSIITPDWEFLVFTPENDLEETVIIMARGYCVTFDNISQAVNWMVHYQDVKSWKVITKIVTLEAKEH